VVLLVSAAWFAVLVECLVTKLSAIVESDKGVVSALSETEFVVLATGVVVSESVLARRVVALV